MQGEEFGSGARRGRFGELLILTSSRTPLHGWLILIEICSKEVKALALAFVLLCAFY
jgi:hypothetical protein